MEAKIVNLVSEVFTCKQARDHQQDQLMKTNASAVRKAILAQARPALNPDTPVDCEPLSACTWKRLSSILAVLMPVFWLSVIKGLWGGVKHTSAGFLSVPNGSDQDASASTQFKRSGGWSADEVARLHHNDPRLLEDPHLACWWRTIVHTAGKCARSFINRAFPENTLYRFCKLPQWPTALPWIAGPRDRGSNKEPGPGGYSSDAACAVQAPQVSGSCRYSPLAHDYVSPPTTCRTRPHTPAETRHPAPNSPASLESAVEPSPTPARAPAQQPSSPLSQPATTHPVFAVSLYLHVSLLFGIAKLGLTTTAGGPREKGHHAKVYFPVTHMAAFRVHLRCPTLDEAARQIRRYEALAFRILSSFVLAGELLLLYFKARHGEDEDEECMLLLFRGVLCYVAQLSLEQVEEQLLALPAGMPPDSIRALLARTVWAAHGAEQQREVRFAKGFAYRAKLPCGNMLATAMGLRDSPCPPVAKADAAQHSLSAHWIFSIQVWAGSLRSRVEDEGFTVVRRASAPDYLLGDHSERDDGSESDGGSGCDGSGRAEAASDEDVEGGPRICKRRRYFGMQGGGQGARLPGREQGKEGNPCHAGVRGVPAADSVAAAEQG